MAAYTSKKGDTGRSKQHKAADEGQSPAHDAGHSRAGEGGRLGPSRYHVPPGELQTAAEAAKFDHGGVACTVVSRPLDMVISMPPVVWPARARTG